MWQKIKCWLGKHEFEPMLLVPIGFGILIGNIPFQLGNEIGIYEEGSVLNILYNGVSAGWYPPLIFLQQLLHLKVFFLLLLL